MSFLSEPEAPTKEVLVLGIGNILWADEGFGPRCVEHFQRRFLAADGVQVADGGTLGHYLINLIMDAKRILVFDCCDFKREPGYMHVLRDEEVKVWTSTKISPHQSGFNDLLATAQLLGYKPELITVIGVQPKEMEDYGGGLTETVHARLSEACDLAQQELAKWGFPVKRRPEDLPAESLMDPSLEERRYVEERPSNEEACRLGDERFLVRPAGHRVEPDFE